MATTIDTLCCRVTEWLAALKGQEAFSVQKSLFDAVLENVNPAIDLALEQTLGRPWLEEWALVAIDALESTLNEYGGQVAPGFECYLGVQTTDVGAEETLKRIEEKLQKELSALRLCCVRHSVQEANVEALAAWIAEVSPMFQEITHTARIADCRTSWAKKVNYAIQAEQRLVVAERVALESAKQEQLSQTLQETNAALTRQRSDQEEQFKAELQTKAREQTKTMELCNRLRQQKEAAEVLAHRIQEENIRLLEDAKSMLWIQKNGLQRESDTFRERTDALEEQVESLSQLNHDLVTEKMNSVMKAKGWSAGVCLMRQIIAQRLKGEVGMRVVIWRSNVLSLVGCGGTDVMTAAVELAEMSLQMEVLRCEKQEAETLAERLVASIDGLVSIKEDELYVLKQQLGTAEKTSSDLSTKVDALQQDLKASRETIAQTGGSTAQLREMIEALKKQAMHAEELKGHVGELEQQVGTLEELVESLQRQSTLAETSAKNLATQLEQKQAEQVEQEDSRKNALRVLEQVSARVGKSECTVKKLVANVRSIDSAPATMGLQRTEKKGRVPASKPSPSRSPPTVKHREPIPSRIQSPLGFGSSVPRKFQPDTSGTPAGRRSSLS